MSQLKKSISLLLLAMLLVVSISMVKAQQPTPPLPDLDEEKLRELLEQATSGQPPPSELTEQEKVLRDKVVRFLTDVFRLDMSGYSTISVWSDKSPFGVFATFNFQSGENELRVTTEFKNGEELIRCKLSLVTDSSVFITPASSDALSTAKDTITSLQAFSAKEYLPTMRSMLNSVTELKNSTITANGFTQEIAVSENTVRISWAPYANGLSNSKSVLILEFGNGHLMFFCNLLDVYTIGSVEVKISEQEAIRIATEHARAYSWEVDNETISNFTIIESMVITDLSLQNRGNSTLYPYWNVWLPLDKMYPGGVTAFHVTLWADTGEVSFISPTGYYGDPNTSPSGDPSEPQAAYYVLAIALATAAAPMVLASYLVYKRKKTAKK